MLYGPHNALGAKVFDVEALAEIGHVLSVDDCAGTVESAVQPSRLGPYRESVVTETRRYRSIYAISGGAQRPVLFHCYGRLS